jgi:hypothetical protein
VRAGTSQTKFRIDQRTKQTCRTKMRGRLIGRPSELSTILVRTEEPTVLQFLQPRGWCPFGMPVLDASFSIGASSGELRRSGTVIKLREQPERILVSRQKTDKSATPFKELCVNLCDPLFAPTKLRLRIGHYSCQATALSN